VDNCKHSTPTIMSTNNHVHNQLRKGDISTMAPRRYKP